MGSPKTFAVVLTKYPRALDRFLVWRDGFEYILLRGWPAALSVEKSHLLAVLVCVHTKLKLLNQHTSRNVACWTWSSLAYLYLARIDSMQDYACRNRKVANNER